MATDNFSTQAIQQGDREVEVDAHVSDDEVTILEAPELALEYEESSEEEYTGEYAKYHLVEDLRTPADGEQPSPPRPMSISTGGRMARPGVIRLTILRRAKPSGRSHLDPIVVDTSEEDEDEEDHEEEGGDEEEEEEEENQ